MCGEGEGAVSVAELERLKGLFPDEVESRLWRAPPPPFGWSPSPRNLGEDLKMDEEIERLR
jgi:hypothetical protein